MRIYLIPQITINEISVIRYIRGSDYEFLMTGQEYKYSDITRKIIEAAMKVHSTLGNGFQEVIYQRALSIEMAEQG
jgi:hypothetical protein